MKRKESNAGNIWRLNASEADDDPDPDSGE